MQQNVPPKAQNAEDAVERAVRRFGIGVEGGIALDPELIDFGAHATFGPIFNPSVQFRPGIEFGIGEVTTTFGINLDVLYTLPGANGQTRWRPYVGAGPNLSLSHRGFDSTTDDDRQPLRFQRYRLRGRVQLYRWRPRSKSHVPRDEGDRIRRIQCPTAGRLHVLSERSSGADESRRAPFSFYRPRRSRRSSNHGLDEIPQGWGDVGLSAYARLFSRCGADHRSITHESLDRVCQWRQRHAALAAEHPIGSMRLPRVTVLDGLWIQPCGYGGHPNTLQPAHGAGVRDVPDTRRAVGRQVHARWTRTVRGGDTNARDVALNVLPAASAFRARLITSPCRSARTRPRRE